MDPKKLYKVLDHLKASGNPFYQFYQDINTFTERMEEEERRLYVSMQNEGEEEIIDLEDQKNDNATKSQKNDKTPESQKDDESEEDEDEKEEKEYREKDVIKKHQVDAYDRSLMLAHNYPEMEHEDGYLSLIHI